MNPLLALAEYGQSYWLDNLTREMLESGELARRVREEGLRGVTSNPSIFHKAISGGEAYEEQIERLAREGRGAEGIYEALVVHDIRAACDVLRPVYDDTDGVDGFLSLEVSPYLVHDTRGTMEEARRLFAAVDRPNVFIKIPGSPAGFAAIEEMLFEGVNVNITLLFSIHAYEAVARAYLEALDRRVEAGKSVDDVASVASFFLSRIDVLTDSLLSQRLRSGDWDAQGPRPETLMGRAAVANAKLAYQSFKTLFSGERWERLAEEGARVQRVLWASTSTKNPLYSDVRYIEPLIGPHTVNTLPDESIAAFADHGTATAGTVEEGLDEAQEVLAGLAKAGIDFEAVTWQLLNEGMDKFTAPYDKLLRALEEHREAILGPSAAGADVTGAEAGDALEAMAERQFPRRLHDRDTSLWTRDPQTAEAIAHRLGWLDCVETFRARTEELTETARSLKEEGIRWTVLAGMGGSSLWPEVSAQVFGPEDGWPELLVLDSTDPEAIRAVERAIDLPHTAFLVSSKSGTTTETLSLYRHFFREAGKAMGGDPAHHFLAITDPGSPLGAEARDRDFRHVFANPEDIGGRYSALSYFGLVPMALLGLDIAQILDIAQKQLTSCGGALPADANSGVHLGTVLGILGRTGHDKITLFAHPRLQPFALWLEQLLAESTGKEGVGLLPVAEEPLGSPDAYGDDRVFVHLTLPGEEEADVTALLRDLSDAGRPVIRLTVDGPGGLAAEIVRWEVATAAAGAVLNINPFDQPNVAESKENTRDLLDRWKKDGGFGVEDPTASGDGLAVWSGGEVQDGQTPLSVVRSLLDGLRTGDYVALLPYFNRTEVRHETLQKLRRTIRARHGVATTLGYGPRYLHSTGQLHKGGPPTGAFIIFTADTNEEIPVPGEEFDFATLLRAQALGDFRALSHRGRRVVRVHLGEGPDERLNTLVNALL
jgi:transaldolase/glucose-6-phosphate isomerase